MNKGIKLATGDWINFMNAGDLFYNLSVLERLHKNFSVDLSILSGKVAMFYDKSFMDEYGDQNVIPHQATFFNSKDIKQLKFNTKYKILADGELLSRMKLLEHYCCQYVNIFIAKFQLGGVGNNPKYLFKRIKNSGK